MARSSQANALPRRWCASCRKSWASPPLHHKVFDTLIHDYPDKRVQLHVMEVSAFAGTEHGREGQTIRWVDVRSLGTLRFPDANRPIVDALLRQAGM